MQKSSYIDSCTAIWVQMTSFALFSCSKFIRSSEASHPKSCAKSSAWPGVKLGFCPWPQVQIRVLISLFFEGNWVSGWYLKGSAWPGVLHTYEKGLKSHLGISSKSAQCRTGKATDRSVGTSTVDIWFGKSGTFNSLPRALKEEEPRIRHKLSRKNFWLQINFRLSLFYLLFFL